jgi:hypothetical protein
MEIALLRGDPTLPPNCQNDIKSSEPIGSK